MRHALLILLVAFATFAAHSSARAEQISVCVDRTYTMPDGVAVPCSSTWALHATCTSQELVHNWVIDGNKPGDHYIRPFADFPIMVVGYEIVKVNGGPTTWFMIGSDHQPDAFLWLGPGEDHARWNMPPWPSKQDAAAHWQPGHEEMIDVHGTCSTPPGPDGKPAAPLPVTLLVIVYYVSMPETAPPTNRAALIIESQLDRLDAPWPQLTHTGRSSNLNAGATTVIDLRQKHVDPIF